MVIVMYETAKLAEKERKGMVVLYNKGEHKFSDYSEYSYSIIEK